MNLNNFKTACLAGAIALLAISCEKAESRLTPEYKGPLKVNFNNYGGTFGLDLPLANTLIDIPIEVKLTNTVDPAPTDIRVKVQMDRNVLYDFNVENGSNYVTPPDSAFTFTPTKELWLTIPKGQRRAGFVAKVNPGKLNLTSEFAVGFSVADAQGAEVNAGDVESKVVVTFNLRNKYDGVYAVRYRLFHPTNPAIVGNSGFEWNFITSGANSVVWETATIMRNFSTGGLTFFGDASGPSLHTNMDVNQTTNAVTVTNVGSRAAALSFPALITPIAGVGTNVYVPASKTFRVSYGWQTTAGDVSTQRSRWDTLVYLRPR
jgi:hypothetical protein